MAKNSNRLDDWELLADEVECDRFTQMSFMNDFTLQDSVSVITYSRRGIDLPLFLEMMQRGVTRAGSYFLQTVKKDRGLYELPVVSREGDILCSTSCSFCSHIS